MAVAIIRRHLSWFKEPMQRQQHSSIDRLPDDILFEIFRCLPLKSVFLCKCVSKRWEGLISDSCFISCYVSDYVQLRARTLENISPPFSLLLNYVDPFIRCKVKPLSSRKKDFTAGGFSLRFIRHSDDRGFLHAVASHKDLLLCRRWKASPSTYVYYVCNPTTKNWLPIPVATGHIRADRSAGHIGFICEPYCGITREANAIKINAQYRFRVVRIEEYNYDQKRMIKLLVFCSEVGRWIESIVPCPRRFEFHEAVIMNAVAYDGKLHWWGGGLLFYNPFSGQGNTDNPLKFIKKPVLWAPDCRISCLGVSRGHFRICQLRKTDMVSNLLVWELDAGDRWQVVYNTYLHTLMQPYMDIRLLEYTMGDKRDRVYPLGFHWHNPNVMFFQFGHRIYRWNIMRRSMSCIQQLSESDIRFLVRDTIVPTQVHPWWPTPLPKLSQCT